MVNLPVEVLNLIFSLLVQRDQLECMTICRQWHNIIQDQSLFQVIYVHCQEQLDRLIERVNGDLTLGKKVERLTLQLKIDSDYDTKIFVQLFPNLRQFTIINLNTYSRNEGFINPLQRHPWCNHIEKMVENSYDLNTKTLLFSGSCKNLTSIDVTGDGSSVRSLTEGLDNAPALKKLYLRDYALDFQDLEFLHERAPLLNSLLLKKSVIDAKSIPLNIKPATLLKSFRCVSSFIDSDIDYNAHLPYVCQKYTHLKEIALELDPLYHDDEDDINPERHHRETFISYLTTLGSRLKTLSLTVDSLAGYFIAAFNFNILDECGCQIEKLELGPKLDSTLIEQLAKTTQVQYIQSLTVNGMVGDDRNRVVSLKWLRHFTVLKELTIYSCDANRFPMRYRVSLTDLLNVLRESRLETLRLHLLELKFDDLNVNHVYPLLKSLTLSRITFQEGTDMFISRVFPNLRHLKLKSCFVNGDSFTLPNTDLSYLEIKNTPVIGSFPTLVITLSNNQQRLYNTRTNACCLLSDEDLQEDMFSLLSNSTRPFDKSKDIPLLTIVCNSIYSFFMINNE